MPNAANAKLQIETSQTSVAMAALTNSGDDTIMTSSAGPWSQVSGFTPVVLPNGIVNGGAVIPAVAAGNNNVDVAALLCNLNGVETSVAADTDVAITRPATTVAKINSITVDANGAIAVVAGTDSSDTSFSEVRAAAGGPPLIAVTSIEAAQVRVVTDADEVITAAQIFAQPGTHREESNSPGYTIDYENGKVTMDSALPQIHTGAVAKYVFASYATASFSIASKIKDWVPVEESSSVSSEQYYGGTEGSFSTSLNQGSFTALLTDGVTDTLVGLKGEVLCFKFCPDRLKNPYTFVQGRLDISRTFPVDNLIQAACTISAQTVGTDHAS